MVILLNHLDRQIGAAQFTEPATDTVLGAHGNNLVSLVEFENFFGTEGDAYPAALAPVSVDDKLLEL